MIIAHLIQDILDIQVRIPVSKEEKFTKEELEHMSKGQLVELRFNYQVIVGSLDNVFTHPSLN